jgi:phenylpropionate dioxygenase-like ring-hydroxylating dioxygenase large terminal subunit
MNRTRAIAFLFCLLATLVAAQAPRSAYDPAPRNAPKQRRDSLVDFTLKQINPADTDYGREIEQARRTLIVATLENVYYWATMTSVGMLVIFFFNWLRSNRESDRREIVAARFLSWYHNELVTARETALEAIQKHRQLQHIIDSQPEAKPAQKTSATSASSSETPAPAVQLAGLPVWQSTSPADVHALQTELNTHRQTINAQQQQIVRLQQQLHGERQKNRTRKGAEPAASAAGDN